MNPAKPILVLVGPTAAGKTALAVAWAKRHGGEIISADSRQIYRNLDIGTGKPDARQLAEVRHHCVSAVNPMQTVTADAFAQMAMDAWRQIARETKHGLLVGGTGLWVKAFMDGLAPVPAGDPAVRAGLEARRAKEGLAGLYQELAAVDPESVQTIKPADKVRIVRALEIFTLSGIRPSELRKRPPSRPPLPGVWFGVTRHRDDLYARAETRIDAWLQAGWMEEVKNLLDQGLPQQAPAFSALGYPHLLGCLRGDKTLAKAVELIKRDTRRYIKRQLTWFQADKRIHWINLSEKSEAQALQEISFPPPPGCCHNR